MPEPLDLIVRENDWLIAALAERQREIKRLLRRNERRQRALLLRYVDGNHAPVDAERREAR